MLVTWDGGLFGLRWESSKSLFVRWNVKVVVLRECQDSCSCMSTFVVILPR